MRFNTGSVSLKGLEMTRPKINIHWTFLCIATMVYAYSIFLASSSDVSVPLPYHTDKLVHFVEFCLLCLMLCWSLSSAPIRMKRIYKIIMAIGVTSLYGLSDEFHQFFTPHRSVDIFDWLADTTGAVTAGFLWYTIAYKWQTKEKPPAAKKNLINT